MNERKELWEEIGTSEAYWAVATHDKFRASNLNSDLKEDFLASGREHVNDVWQTFERLLGNELKPTRALDYGCGVGRLVLPLAERCDHVIGVDISSAMLREAAKNAESRGLSNITLQTVDEFIADENAEYDFVHTYIVLQHIRPAIGYAMIETMLDRLKVGGHAMIHTTFVDKSPLFGRIRARLYRDVPGVHRSLNLIRGRTLPFVPVYTYDLERVRSIFRDRRLDILDEREIDHSVVGRMFFLKRS
ncbi:MAG: methyltransferase domain-containing protein [Acidobacteria bacterium]|nr:methyltransferase domain-containing protein [Acidobacteriota bacterium]